LLIRRTRFSSALKGVSRKVFTIAVACSSLASNGRTAAVFWIRKTEEINDEPLPDNIRREIIDYASSKYAKLFRKHNNDFKETDSALVGLFNAKFGYLREI
jgi:hypothetical protein